MPPSAYASLTIDPASTFNALLWTLAAAFVFIIVRAVASTSLARRSWLVVMPLVTIAALEAGIALFQAARGAQAVGTYRDGDPLATLMEMALPLVAGYLLALASASRPRLGWTPWRTSHRRCARGRARHLFRAALLGLNNRFPRGIDRVVCDGRARRVDELVPEGPEMARGGRSRRRVRRRGRPVQNGSASRPTSPSCSTRRG